MATPASATHERSAIQRSGHQRLANLLAERGKLRDSDLGRLARLQDIEGGEPLSRLIVRLGLCITEQPTDLLDICVGPAQPMLLTVDVSGTPLAYEWYKDGALQPGQTSQNLILNPVTASDTGDYFVRVIGSDCSVTSRTEGKKVRTRRGSRVSSGMCAT